MEHIVKHLLAVLILCLLGVERSLQTTVEQAMMALKQRVIAMEGEIGRLQTHNEQMLECVTHISSNTVQCAKENFMADSSYGRNAMFSAHWTKIPDTFPVEQIIAFDSVDINVGNCYNNHTGVFTCNKAGAYVFFWSITTSHYTETELMKNNSTVAVNNASEAENHSTGTMMVLLHLNADDDVKIKMKSKSPPPKKIAAKWCTFSGMLIRG